MYIDLATAKRHLNLEQSFTDDDIYITSLINVAEKVVENQINTSLEWIIEDNGSVLPEPLFQAILIYVGHLYSNRELATFTNVNKMPYSFDYLTDFYKNYSQIL